MSEFKRMWPTCTKEQIEQHKKEYIAYRIRVKREKQNVFGGHDWYSIIQKRSAVLNNLILACQKELEFLN